MKIKNRIMRSTAATLCVALIHASFGVEAWAQVAPVAGVSAPLGGNAGAAGASVNSGSQVGSMPTATAMTLTGAPTFLAASAPSFAAPSAALPLAALSPLPASAIAAPKDASARRAATALASIPVSLPGTVMTSAPAPAMRAAPAASTSEQGTPAPSVAAAPALSENAAASSLEGGPKTRAAGNAITRRFAELRAFFGGRKDAGVLADAAPAPAAMTGVDAGAASVPHASALAPAPKDGDKVAQGGGDNAPPAPPTADQAPAPKGRHWLIPFFLLLSGLLIIQFGLEAQGVALAQLTHEAFGDFTVLATALLFSQGGSMIGQARSSEAIARFGRRNTFLVGNLIRGLTIAAILGLLSLHAMPMWGMFGLYLMNGVVTGIVATADQSLRKNIIGVQHLLQFKLTWQLLAEIIGTYAPMILGRQVTIWGASAITAIYPVALIGAMAYLWAVRILPKDAAKPATEAAEAVVRKPWLGLKGLFKKISDGAVAAWTSVSDTVRHPRAAAARLFASVKASALGQGAAYVWKTPLLRFAFLGAAMFDVQNIIIYRMFAPGAAQLQYGAAHMSQEAGNMVGMYSSGGLYLALALTFLPLAFSFGMRLWRRFVTKKAVVEEKKDYTFADREKDLKKAYRSTMFWAVLGVPAVFLLATFALPASTLGAAFALPAWFTATWIGAKIASLTVIQAALVPYGFLQVGASVKLNNLFQVSLPDSKLYPKDSKERQISDDLNDKAFAFEGFSMTALSMLLIFSLRPLFSHLATFNPFPYIAWSLIPAVAVLAFVVIGLMRSKLPPADPIGHPSPDASAGPKE